MKFLAVRVGSVLVALAFCLLLDKMALGTSTFIQRMVLLAGLYVTLAVSLNLINGITGQFSIGHAAFYQVGAYTAGLMAAKFFGNWHLPPGLWLLVCMLVSAVTAAIAGLIVGLPSLRLKGDYLAIVTLGFGEIIRIIAQNQPVLGGAYGLPLPNQAKLKYIWIVWALAITCIAVCRNLLKTAHGLPFLAVREDEVASSAMGVNVTRVKVTAFLIGSAFAGAAGALYAHNEGFISPPMFAMDLSILVVAMVVLGGTGSITGSVLAAVVLFYLPEKMRDIKEVQLSTLLALGLAIALSVAAVRWIVANQHGTFIKRIPFYVGVLVGALVITYGLGAALGTIPSMKAMVDGSKLRYVLLAVTLIVLMLVRPQGVFAHHEFSWSWVEKLLGKKNVPTSEVAA